MTLASHTSVAVAELLDEPTVGSSSNDPVWDDFWLLADHRDGTPVRIVAQADTSKPSCR